MNPQSLNRYSYCLNNPLKYTDPSGHDQIITTGGVNSNGETWYTISDGAGNLLAIATGIDDLAAKMAACSSVSSTVNLTSSALAAAYGTLSTTSIPTPVTVASVQVTPPAPATPTTTTSISSANNSSANVGTAAGTAVSAVFAITIPENASILGHIFREDTGHYAVDTLENREALLETANNGNNYVKTDIWGKSIYARINPDGKENWVYVRNNEIVNGGLNVTPRYTGYGIYISPEEYYEFDNQKYYGY